MNFSGGGIIKIDHCKIFFYEFWGIKGMCKTMKFMWITAMWIMIKWRKLMWITFKNSMSGMPWMYCL